MCITCLLALAQNLHVTRGRGLSPALPYPQRIVWHVISEHVLKGILDLFLIFSFFKSVIPLSSPVSVFSIWTDAADEIMTQRVGLFAGILPRTSSSAQALSPVAITCSSLSCITRKPAWEDGELSTLGDKAAYGRGQGRGL